MNLKNRIELILFFKSSWCKTAIARKGIESILSQKQQRRPLPHLLYLSFYAFNTQKGLDRRRLFVCTCRNPPPSPTPLWRRSPTPPPLCRGRSRYSHALSRPLIWNKYNKWCWIWKFENSKMSSIFSDIRLKWKSIWLRVIIDRVQDLDLGNQLFYTWFLVLS